MSILDKARVWWREHRERVAEKKATKATGASAHHESRFWLLTLPGTMILFAGGVEIVWAILFCIEATGHAQLHVEWATGTTVPHVSKWDFAFSSDVLLLLALMAATVPIVIWSMVWLPVQMKARGQGRWRRTTMISAGLICNALVIVSGTVVMNANRQEQVRAGLVVEQSADQGRAALQARYNAVHDRWATLTASSNTTLQAQAARAGVAGWDAYIATARQQASAGTITPERLALIERAKGSAVASEQYQHDMDGLTGQIAAAAPAAASAAHVQDDVGAPMDSFAEHVKVYRPAFVALSCTILGIFGAWWLIGLIEALNANNIASSGWADEEHRIEDLRTGEPVTPEPMVKMKEKVFDADTGKEMVYRKGTWAKRPARKGKAEKIQFNPDAPDLDAPAQTGTGDERGVLNPRPLEPDGEHQTEESTDAQEHSADQTIAEPISNHVAGDAGVHPEPPVADATTDLTEEEMAALETTFAASEHEAAPEEKPASDANPDQIEDTQPTHDEPISTALTPQGYVFDDEDQEAHAARRRIYEEELAK